LILSLADAAVFANSGCFLVIQDPHAKDPQLGHQLTLQFHDIDHYNIPVKNGLPTLVPPIRSQIEVALRFCEGQKVIIVGAVDGRTIAFARLLGMDVEGEPNKLVMKLGEEICRGG